MILSSVGNNVFKPLKRNIASVSNQPIAKLKDVHSPIIEIDCKKKSQATKLKTKAVSARVLFKNCKEVGRPINESNQNQGDIFPLKKHHWTSDFIFLKQGSNKIIAPLGEKIQTIEIIRQKTKKLASSKAL